MGDGFVDHSYWGRPEDMTMARPAWAITTAAPGSELAGETAAAMAAASILFKTANPGIQIVINQKTAALTIPTYKKKIGGRGGGRGHKVFTDTLLKGHIIYLNSKLFTDILFQPTLPRF